MNRAKLYTYLFAIPLLLLGLSNAFAAGPYPAELKRSDHATTPVLVISSGQSPEAVFYFTPKEFWTAPKGKVRIANVGLGSASYRSLDLSYDEFSKLLGTSSLDEWVKDAARITYDDTGREGTILLMLFEGKRTGYCLAFWNLAAHPLPTGDKIIPPIARVQNRLAKLPLKKVVGL